MLKNTTATPDSDNKNTDFQHLRTEVEQRTKLQEICNKINAALDLDEILIGLRDEITSLFEAERLTIYVLDGRKRKFVSKYKSGEEIRQISVPISPTSISGYTALKQKTLNIKNAYDKDELSSIDPLLKFDESWDKKTGFTTRQVLTFPIIYKKFLLGVIQLINRTDGGSFRKNDEEYLKELANIMAIALYNQKRMVKPKPGKFDSLLLNNILTQKELDKAIADARKRKEPVELVLINDFNVSKKDIGESLSQYYNTPFVAYNNNITIPDELLVGLKIPFMRNNFWIPLRIEDDTIVIAIDNPHDVKKIDEITALFPGKRLRFCVSLKEDILSFINLFARDKKEICSIDQILSQLQDEDESIEEIEDAEISLNEESSAVVQLVNKIILDAHDRGASDIHIEPYPGKQQTRIRIRVDGNCVLYQTIPYHYRNAVISRIKIMADLDIAERRKPQDGKIKFKKYAGKDIELRVATVPTQGGMEDVVMRILAAGEPISLDKIGFSKNNYKNFLSAVTKPYGIIFVCGPTGSGKTTTLHSALGYINKTETKIWTAEDPVEITQKGLRQVQVKPMIGFDFAAAMRAFLRADPDVIMVGEMRDQETAQIGIEASLTGHLVFSTLHTNSAPESITRLLDMGMDPFNFADAILCILAQRLVRTLCQECKEAYHPSKEEYDELVREYGREEFKTHLNIPYSDDLTLYRAKGCDACNNIGYRGRMGIHELLMGTDGIKKLIQNKARMEEIRDLAIQEGMTTLKQDGIEKIFGGHCDLLQVRRVCIK